MCRGSVDVTVTRRARGAGSTRRESVAVAREALAGERAWIVGGAIRDAALGDEVRDLDLAVDRRRRARRGAGDRRRARAGSRSRSPRSTATWRAVGAGRAPGTPTSPRCAASSIEADLRARDFTVNAVAVPLRGGEPIDPPAASRDAESRAPARGLRALVRRGPAAAAARGAPRGALRLSSRARHGGARARRGAARGRARRRAPVRRAARGCSPGPIRSGRSA